MNFFFYGSQYDPVWVPHQSAALAEGLSALGHTCFGEIGKLKSSKDGDCIIRYSQDIAPQDCDAILFNSQIGLFADIHQELKKLFRQTKRNCPVIFIDEADGLRTPGFDRQAHKCLYVLKSHYNGKMEYPKNFIPWQFGITNRFLDYIHPIPVKDRGATVAVNFRVHHQLREYMNAKVLPLLLPYLRMDNTTDNTNDVSAFPENDRFLHQQARGRHNPFYYQRIPKSLFTATYGGVFCLPFGNHDKYTAKIARMANRVIPVFQFDRIRQWDSWRFWESLTAGCITLHADLEKFGCHLPVMPVNYRDYIGIDPYHPDIFNDWLSTAMAQWKNGSPTLLESVSAAGRKFVLDHYTPVHVAGRFLELLRP